MVRYRYTPLSGGKRSIRLLSLSAGTREDEIHIELKNSALEEKVLPYEALSYVWGSAQNPIRITIGSARKYAFLVTKNLALALQHLRNPNKPRILWVDAVCINQNDPKERSSQVEIMSDIYRVASRVVIWLGPEDNNSCRALKLLQAIGSTIEADWVNYSFKQRASIDGKSSSLSDLTDVSQYCDTDFDALYHLFHREWFERLWIRQEIGLAADAIIACSLSTMPWETFRNGIFYIYNMLSSQPVRCSWNRFPRFADRLKLVYTVCDHKIYLLDSLRTEMTQVKCSDPRDRIYANLSLLHPSHQAIGIIPNYSLTTIRVYEEATLRFIDYWKSLSILFQCELQDGPLLTPTWVPDWSKEMLANTISGAPSNASGYLEAIATYRGDGILNVTGLIVATILKVHPICFDEDGDLEAIFTDLWVNMVPRGLLDTNPSGRRQLEIFCDTLSCGLFRHTTIPVREDFPDFELSVKLMASLLGIKAQDTNIKSTAEDEDGWRQYTSRAKEVCQNRCFFVTLQGSIGLAPLTAKIGDEICVLLGCDSTILLRPIRSHLHQVVGQSYMSGINTGEALLGPLPKHLNAVNYYNCTAQAFYFAYKNNENGKVGFEDPRLLTLPLDLTFHEDLWRRGDFQRVKLDLKALRKAGIDVKTFDLT